MSIYEIIDKKRHGGTLSREEICFFVDGYMKEHIADYQASALLMAICINSMNDDEIFYLTEAMMNSGEVIDLSAFGDLSVDKHSTGGVGDKTTLIVAPIVACLGCYVAKMSGRGLGFTGGTVDKLESIPGYKTSPSLRDFLTCVSKTGICVVGQSANLAPCDKKLYALRDVTATVESIPLIASSIMSKKLASGAKSIVLDVKVGSGAFMKNIDDATKLALTMKRLGERFGRNVKAIITNMDVPLGAYVGNSVEVFEAIWVLSGNTDGPLGKICIELASNMVSCALNLPLDEAYQRVNNAIFSGKALLKMKEWILAQGGDVSYISTPSKLLCAPFSCEYISKSEGYISGIDARSIGCASMMLGAGRTTKEDVIESSVGIRLNKSYGDYVRVGDSIATVYYSNKVRVKNASNMLDRAFSFSNEQPPELTLVHKII